MSLLICPSVKTIAWIGLPMILALPVAHLTKIGLYFSSKTAAATKSRKKAVNMIRSLFIGRYQDRGQSNSPSGTYILRLPQLKCTYYSEQVYDVIAAASSKGSPFVCYLSLRYHKRGRLRERVKKLDFFSWEGRGQTQ